MSVLYIGAYAWSNSDSNVESEIETGTESIIKTTTVTAVSVSVNNASCFNCEAVTNSVHSSFGANAYGGFMSVVYVGGYASSVSVASKSSSICAQTIASHVSVSISNSRGYNCSSRSGSYISEGSNSYGGSISAVYVGMYAYSYSIGGKSCRVLSLAENTFVDSLVVSIDASAFLQSRAISGKRSDLQTAWYLPDAVS
jgi:hypothetical protein